MHHFVFLTLLHRRENNMLLEISSIFILQGFFVNHYNQSIYQKVSGRIQINLDKGRRRSYFLPTFSRFYLSLYLYSHFLTTQTFSRFYLNHHLSHIIFFIVFVRLFPSKKIPYLIWTIIIQIMYLYFLSMSLSLYIFLSLSNFRLAFPSLYLNHRDLNLVFVLYLSLCLDPSLSFFSQTKESHLYSMK